MRSRQLLAILPPSRNLPDGGWSGKLGRLGRQSQVRVFLDQAGCYPPSEMGAKVEQIGRKNDGCCYLNVTFRRTWRSSRLVSDIFRHSVGWWCLPAGERKGPPNVNVV